jgi:hypothetical protein
VPVLVSIVPKEHGPHCFTSQDTQKSHKEQEKGGADGNGVVKGGSVVAGGIGIGELVGESVEGTGVEVGVGTLVGIGGYISRVKGRFSGVLRAI